MIKSWFLFLINHPFPISLILIVLGMVNKEKAIQFSHPDRNLFYGRPLFFKLNEAKIRCNCSQLLPGLKTKAGTGTFLPRSQQFPHSLPFPYLPACYNNAGRPKSRSIEAVYSERRSRAYGIDWTKMGKISNLLPPTMNARGSKEAKAPSKHQSPPIVPPCVICL